MGRRREGGRYVHRDSNSYANDWTCLHEGIRRVSATCTRNFAWMCVRTYTCVSRVSDQRSPVLLIPDLLKHARARTAFVILSHASRHFSSRTFLLPLIESNFRYNCLIFDSLLVTSVECRESVEVLYTQKKKTLLEICLEI